MGSHAHKSVLDGIFFSRRDVRPWFRDLPGALGPWTSPTCFAQPSLQETLLGSPRHLLSSLPDIRLSDLTAAARPPSCHFAGVSHEIFTLKVQCQCAAALHSTAIT